MAADAGSISLAARRDIISCCRDTTKSGHRGARGAIFPISAVGWRVEIALVEL